MARRSPAKRPPPATPEEGAAYVRKFMLELFDRKDGEAADWPLIARTLFVAAFDVADRLPKDNARHALLRRVHEGSYNRLTDDAGALKTNHAPASPSPSRDAVSPCPGIHAGGVR
jgi:hypothetical protein